MKRLTALLLVLLCIGCAGILSAEERSAPQAPAVQAGAAAPAPQATAPAPAALKIDSGDTAWVLMCTALVMLMTPGSPSFTAAW